MDHDDDGILDIISGSYDPGDIWLFRGLGKGRYSKGEVLLDEAGVPVVHHPRELKLFEELRKTKDEDDDAVLQARVASFGSWPAPVDWDADGDLDLLIGTFRGAVHLRRNIGTRKVPKYAADSPAVAAGGVPLQVNTHANPVVADWNGDGTWDLVVGAGDGSVHFFANTGTKGEPKFAPAKTLVPAKAKDKFLRQVLMPDEVPKPGVRAQICVVDFDLDGKLDLLVGDYSDVQRARGDLTAEQKAELSRIVQQEAALREGIYDETKATALATSRNALCEKRDRSTSHVWLYRRVGP